MVDVAWHTEIACVIDIIPVELDATEAFAGPVDVDFFVMVAEALDEVVGMFSVTEFRQPLQVQSHLEMPGILVQLGHTQRT